MVYIITDDGVLTGKTINAANKKLNAKLEDVEMVSLGADKVVKLTDNDIDFVQDKKRLSLIPISNLYKTDNTVKYMTIGILILNFILLVKK
jgi:hypothetical protein